ALSGKWPSYDKLHALYTDPDFSFEGYATSGALVAYLLRSTDANKLPLLLEDYFYLSMPWWWPWSAIPFVDSMPMDRSLKRLADVNGPKLYENYKKAATEFWRSQDNGEFLLGKAKRVRDFSFTHSIQARGNRIYKLESDNGRVYERELQF